MRRDNALGIYISIPFCRSKCTYCNFASGVYPASDHARYVERLIEDLVWCTNLVAKVGAELAASGHGVPGRGNANTAGSRVADAHVCRFAHGVRLDTDAEITVECAPGQLADAMLEAMMAAGVNRVSLGVQSFVDSEAGASGRCTDRATVEADLRRFARQESQT